MKPKEIIDKIERFLCSDFLNVINLVFPRGASLGGFILSVNIFFRKIENVVIIDVAAFASLICSIILIINEVVKQHYFEKTKNQFQQDRAAIDNVCERLTLENTLRERYPADYRDILTLLRATATNEETAARVTRYSAGSTSNYRLAKYPMAFIDILMSMVMFASAIFISFIVVIVLKNESDDQALKISGICLAMSAALYSGICALARTHKSWQMMEHEKSSVGQSIGRLRDLQRDLPADNVVNTPALRKALLFWSRNNVPQPVSPAPAAQAAPQMV